MVLNRMAKGAKEIDMAATLEHIRDQRMNMVQTKVRSPRPARPVGSRRVEGAGSRLVLTRSVSEVGGSGCGKCDWKCGWGLGGGG